MDSKYCPRCEQEKDIDNFYKNIKSKDGHLWCCKECHKKYYKRSREEKLAYQEEYRKNNKEKIKKFKQRLKHQKPWKSHLYDAKNRCENPNNKRYNRYGDRGIEFRLTDEDGEFLWNRDKAYDLKQPSIDRIDNDGHYELDNCRFIENAENVAKDKRKAVLQYDLEGNFIKEWISVSEPEKFLSGKSKGKVSQVAKNKRKTAYGFIWKYKE